MDSEKPVVLITGCSSGIGEALCRQFQRKGCSVIATARRVDALSALEAEGIATKKLDVNSRADIDRVVREVLKDHHKIDILVNNAGYALISPAIDLSDAGFRAQLETNLIAPLTLTKAVAPNMREQGRGKIVNIGSISGIVTTPFSGAYCASKAALHSLSDALRMELSPFGIQVITVQPGAIASRFGENAAQTVGDGLSTDSWYSSLEQAINERAKLSQQAATSAGEFSEALVDLLLKGSPPAVIRLGKKSRLLPALKRLLPTRVLDRILIAKFKLDSVSRGGSIEETP